MCRCFAAGSTRSTRTSASIPSGHSGKALRHAVASLPRDLLINLSLDSMRDLVMVAMSLADRPRPGAAAGPLHPQGPPVRLRLAAARRADDRPPHGDRADARAEVGHRGDRAGRWNSATATSRSSATRNMSTPTRRLAGRRARSTWRSSRWSAAGPRPSRRSWSRQSAARAPPVSPLATFPTSPKAIGRGPRPMTPPRTSFACVTLRDDSDRGVRHLASAADPKGQLRLKTYRRGGLIPLSEAVPVLENFGFRVLEEMPTALDWRAHRATSTTSGSRSAARPTCESILPARAEIESRDRRRALRARPENDEFNQLVALRRPRDRARWCWLRAWFRYLRQTGVSYGLVTVVDALRRAPKSRAALIDLFDARPRSSLDERRRRGRRCRRRIRPRRSAGVAVDRRRPHPAPAARAWSTRCCAPMPSPRRRRKRWRSRSIPRMVPGLPAPRAVARDLGLQPARRGHPPARRPDRARRPALVGPARRFPHRDPRPDEGAAGQERGHRADRRQGRLLSQAAAARRQPRRLARRRARRATASSSARLLSVTDNLVEDKVVHPDRCRHPRRRRSLFRRRRRQGHGDLLRHRQRDRARTQLLARRRLRQRRLERLRPQGDGDHRQGRLDLGPAPLPRDGRRRPDGPDHASPAAATCRATCSATACCCRRRSSWSPPSTTATSSSIPTPIREASCERARSACSTCRARAGTITTASCCRRAAASSRARQKTIELSQEARQALGIDAKSVDPATLITAILKSPVDLLWFGGIGTYIKASSRDPGGGRRPVQRCDPGRWRRGPREGDRRGRQPCASPRPAGSSSPSMAAASTPTSSTIRPASIARTMRSTSRSRSTAR